MLKKYLLDQLTSPLIKGANIDPILAIIEHVPLNINFPSKKIENRIFDILSRYHSCISNRCWK